MSSQSDNNHSYYKCIRLVGLHPFCAVVLSTGYALREYGAFNYLYYSTQNLITYVLSQVFIYICPPLLELANYHVLGRIFYYVPYLSPLSPGKVRPIFGALMALVETLNALGVSLSSNPSSSHTTQKLGRYLIIAALALQLVVIIVFIIFAFVFHRRCARANVCSKAVSTPLTTLYVSMSLILIRCIYRLVEHQHSTAIDLDDIDSLRALGPLLRYEWFFYVFEAALILVNSVLWNTYCPGRYIPRNYNVYLARDGWTELESEVKPDERSLLAKSLSVLSFGMLFRKKEHWVGDELGAYPVGTTQTQA